MQQTFALAEPVDEELADELVKEFAYVAKDVTSAEVSPDRKSVVVGIADGADLDAVVDKVERYLAAMLSGYRGELTKISHTTSRRSTGPFQENVYEELQRRRWLFDLGEGHVGLAGPALRLGQLVDAAATARYRQAYGAEERSFSALIGNDLLARCGYLDAHPQNVNWVTHLTEDIDVIEEFRQANAQPGAPGRPALDALDLPRMGLNPAACLPAYKTFEDSALPPDGVALSWQGRVFRHEATNVSGLDRLSEFTVRELLFLADGDRTRQWRDRSVELIVDLAEAFDLDMTVQLATDPFFATVAGARRFWQQSMESKYEIRLAIGRHADGRVRTVAAGSVNVHGTFFAEQFGITTGTGELAETACVGLGIERWILAVFAQHGFDEAHWPELMRTELTDDTRRSE
ncbi:hypothetical protein AB0K14_30020 [Actinosynnema sp. NPDC050801]|uniref:hypothetical protein n=1 Tax=unclassified Actinosynnema TaxID=2637065 RepID=UPI0033C186D7